MSKRQSAFLQTDVSRAIRGAEAAGMSIAGVEIRPDGTVFVRFGEPLSCQDSPPPKPQRQIII